MYLRAIHCAKLLQPGVESARRLEWRQHEHRPYMRAQRMLAAHFAVAGNHGAAADCALLLFNRAPSAFPAAHERAEVAHWLVAAEQSRRSEDFLDTHFAAATDIDTGVAGSTRSSSCNTHAAFGRVLVNFCKYQVVNDYFASEEWHPELEASLRAARAANQHVLACLLSAGAAHEAPGWHQHVPTPGSQAEAELYTDLARDAWQQTTGALGWLLAATTGVNRLATPQTVQKGPSGSDSPPSHATDTWSHGLPWEETGTTTDGFADESADGPDGAATQQQQATPWFQAERDDAVFAAMLGLPDDPFGEDGAHQPHALITLRV